MNPLDLPHNDDYLALPQSERAKVVKTLMEKNEDFQHLPDPEKVKVLDYLVQYQGKPKQPQAEQPIQKPSVSEAAVKMGKDFFTKPTEGHKFDWKNIAESGATGMALGAPFGGVPGALAGGGLGLISGAVGEVARSMGAPEGVAMGAELASGGLGSIVNDTKGILAKVISGWKTNRAIKEAKLLGRDYTPNLREVKGAEKAAKEKAELIKKPEVIPIGTTETYDIVNQHNLNKLNQMGIKTTPGQKASNAVRNTMYAVMSRLNEHGLYFWYSPQMKEVVRKLYAGEELSQLSSSARSKIFRILASPLSGNPETREQANSAINNLIQKGEVYSSSEGKAIKIFDPDGPVGRQLRASFDKYLQNATGNRLSYEGLKLIEQSEFQAKSVDNIGEMLASGFKQTGTKEVENDLRNIKGAGQQGKKMFGEALAQHFYDTDPDRLMAEFNRLRPMLIKSEIFEPKELNSLQKRLAAIPKKLPFEKIKQQASRAIRASLVGGLVSETAQYPQTESNE